MNKNRITMLAVASLLLLCSFTITQPVDTGYWWSNAQTSNGQMGSNVDKNLCITIFGVVSLALVIYLFKKKTFSMAENESNVSTSTMKRAHGFHVSS